MTDKPTYEELAEKLANFVRENFYYEEKRINLPPVMVFHNLYESDLQLVSKALTSVGITKCIDGGGRHVFTCEPDQFRVTALENEASGCSYDMLVLCSCEMVRRNVYFAQGLFECLVRLGVCEPNLARRRKPIVRAGSKGIVVLPPGYGPEHEWTVQEVVWTEKYALYDKMMHDWMNRGGPTVWSRKTADS